MTNYIRDLITRLRHMYAQRVNELERKRWSEESHIDQIPDPDAPLRIVRRNQEHAEIAAKIHEVDDRRIQRLESDMAKLQDRFDRLLALITEAVSSRKRKPGLSRKV